MHFYLTNLESVWIVFVHKLDFRKALQDRVVGGAADFEDDVVRENGVPVSVTVQYDGASRIDLRDFRFVADIEAWRGFIEDLGQAHVIGEVQTVPNQWKVFRSGLTLNVCDVLTCIVKLGRRPIRGASAANDDDPIAGDILQKEGILNRSAVGMSVRTTPEM